MRTLSGLQPCLGVHAPQVLSWPLWKKTILMRNENIIESEVCLLAQTLNKSRNDYSEWYSVKIHGCRWTTWAASPTWRHCGRSQVFGCKNLFSWLRKLSKYCASFSGQHEKKKLSYNLKRYHFTMYSPEILNSMKCFHFTITQYNRILYLIVNTHISPKVHGYNYVPHQVLVLHQVFSCHLMWLSDKTWRAVEVQTHLKCSVFWDK